MAQASNGKHRNTGEIRLYTLTEVADSINVSMPTAQRYKRVYQNRIPAVGMGRKQRYPREAIKVFEQIKLENLSNRGRPVKVAMEPQRLRRKSTARKGKRRTSKTSTRSRTTSQRKAAARIPTRQTELLTLTEISKRTGISYPTCINYVKRHLERIPHVGTGRRRRYPPEAATVFRELRNRSRSGRRRKAVGPSRRDKALLRRMRELEKSQRQLTRQIESILKTLSAPLKVTIKRG